LIIDTNASLQKVIRLPLDAVRPHQGAKPGMQVMGVLMTSIRSKKVAALRQSHPHTSDEELIHKLRKDKKNHRKKKTVSTAYTRRH